MRGGRVVKNEFEGIGFEDEWTCEGMQVVFPILTRLGSGIHIELLTLGLG